MALAASISPLVVRDILDKVGVDDSSFSNGTLNISLPGPKTAESIELEDSIRRLIDRVQRLQPNSATDRPPISKKASDIKNGGYPHKCLSCGHALDFPLTPDESSPVAESNGPVFHRTSVSSGCIDQLTLLICQ